MLATFDVSFNVAEFFGVAFLSKTSEANDDGRKNAF